MQSGSVLKCPNCGNENLVFDFERGEYICPKCGLVVLERVVDFEHPEYRVYRPEEAYRVHYAPNEARGTVIDVKSVSPKIKFNKLLTIQQIVHYVYEHKFEENVEKYIRALAQVLNLSNEVTLYACKLIKKFYPIVKDRGRRSGKKLHCCVAMACLLISCLEHKVDLSIRDFIDKAKKLWGFHFNIYEIFNLLQEIGYPLNKIYVEKKNTLYATVNKVLDLLNISDEERYILRKIFNVILSKDVLNKLKKVMHKSTLNCKGFIAALLYVLVNILCSRKVLQKEVAKMIGVTEVTIRNYMRKLDNVVIELEFE